MKAADSERTAVDQSPVAVREPSTGHSTGALSVPQGSAGLLLALQRSAGNAAVSGLVARRAATRLRAIQRGVYVESGTRAVAVPRGAKAHAAWVMARDQPGGKLDRIVVPVVLNAGTPYQRTIYKFEKFKDTWYVGHMFFDNNNQPDRSRLPLADTYREYDIKEQQANRGTERIVIGQTSRRKWYTNNHYVDFTEFA
jgi:hypothetical protein